MNLKFEIVLLIVCLILPDFALAMEVQKDYFSKPNLEKSYSIATKFENSLIKLCSEPKQEEYQYLHEAFHAYLDKKYELDKYSTCTDTKILFQANTSLFDVIKEAIVETMHDKYFRIPVGQEEWIKQKYPFGLIYGFLKVKDTEKIADTPFSIGQAVMVSQNMVLTAKHVMEAHKELRKPLNENILPKGFNENTEELAPIYLFSYPTSEKEDKTSWIESVFSVSEQIKCGPKEDERESDALDIALASLKEPIKSTNIAFLTKKDGTEKNSNVFMFYIEHDGEKYRFYKIDFLNIVGFKDIQGISDRLRKRLFITNKFLKPGISGSGILYSETKENLTILGIYNGKIDVKIMLGLENKEEVYQPLFHLSPIFEHYETLAKNIK